MKRILLFTLLMILFFPSVGQDLVVTGQTIPTSAFVYQALSGTVTIKNTGIVDITNPSYSGVYLSMDNVLDNDDYYYGSADFSQLAAGATITADVVGDRVAAAAGTYYLIIKADPNNLVTETNKNNNIFTVPGFVVNASTIDFTMGTFTLPSTTIFIGDRINPSYMLAQTGQPDMTDAPVYTSFFISADNKYDATDIAIGFGVSIFGQENYVSTLSVPNMSPGNYFLIAHVDGVSSNQGYNEVNEDNNVVVASAVTIKVSDIDLNLFAGQARPSAFFNGNNINVSYSYTNTGTTGVINYLQEVFLSTDTIIDSNDFTMDYEVLTHEGYYATPGTNMFGSYYNYSDQNKLPEGEFYVIVRLNGDHKIPETNFANNTAATANSITIRYAASLIAISGVSLVKPVSMADASVDMNITITNGGPRYFTSGYLSTSLIDSLGNTLYTRSDYFGAFVGGNSTRTSAITRPLNVPAAGKHTMQFLLTDTDTKTSASYTFDFQVQKASTLSGTVSDEDGNAINKGSLFLYTKDNTTGLVSFKRTTTLTSSSFSFVAGPVPTTLYFIPDDADASLVPTIFGKTTVLDPSSFFTPTKDTSVLFTILKIHPLGVGGRIISGTVNDGQFGGRRSAPNPELNLFSDSWIVVLLNEAGTPVAKTKTVDGHYSFVNIPVGEYQVVVFFNLAVPGNTAVPADVTAQNIEVNFDIRSGRVETSSGATRQVQNITFEFQAEVKYGDHAVLLKATADTGLPVTFESSGSMAYIYGDSVYFENVGTVTITARQAGNETYAPIFVARTLNVLKGDQTITFDELPMKHVDDPPFDLTASASSGSSVEFTSSDPSVASVDFATVTLLKKGVTTITANAPGYSLFNDAPSVGRVLQVDVVTGLEPGTSFEAYPNPTTGILSLTTDGIVNEVQLITPMGSSHRLSVQHQTVDLREFAAGIYFLRLNDNRGARVLKVVKL